MPKITDVAVAVLQLPDGQFLLASRPTGKPYAGYWEFPGGKIEANESVRDALIRELREELNIVITNCAPWFSFNMVYPHATVRLHTWRVRQWRGADARGLMGLEGQQFQWQRLDTLTVAPILPGCLPIFRALSLPKHYLITNASEVGTKAYLQHLRAYWGKSAPISPPNGEFAALDNSLIQVREKSMPPAQLRDFAREIVAIAAEYNAIVLINSDESLANEVGADGVHLTSRDLTTRTTRPNVAWVGASAHSHADLQRAAEIGCDFAVLGHVKATASHVDTPPLGWEPFAAMVTNTSIPVYAIGGMMHADIDIAITHGAHGIAMMRSIFRTL
jgi:8-oxo-dGTP diphosphatase